MRRRRSSVQRELTDGVHAARVDRDAHSARASGAPGTDRLAPAPVSG